MLVEAGLLLFILSETVLSAPTSSENPLSLKPFENGLKYYYPAPLMIQNEVGDTTGLTEKSTAELEAVAIDFMMKELKVTDRNRFDITTSLQDETGTLHYHCKPKIDGIQVANANANVNVDKFGQVLSMGHSWTTNKLVKREVTDPISPLAALKAFATVQNVPFDESKVTTSTNGDKITVKGASFASGDISISTKYFRTGSSVVKSYDLSVPMGANFYNAFVSHDNGEVLGLTNWASKSLFSSPHMTKRSTVNLSPKGPAPRTKLRKLELAKRQNQKTEYSVANLPKKDFSKGVDVVVNPQDLTASPLGWHNDGTGETGTTSGNNVVAGADGTNDVFGRFGNEAEVSANSQNFQFNFKADDNNQVPPQYRPAAITNMFVLSNEVHDITTKYGFTEAAGNFQKQNLDNVGKGNDPVIAIAQDGSGTNNANFATPPDGESGIMRMFIFTTAANGRDGAFDNMVVSHELMHGISSRLTGGADDPNCLNSLESGGMGEGWSDVLSIFLTQTDKDTRNDPVPIGTYATNSQAGVRRFPYSTDLSVNSLKFSDLNDPQNAQVHNIGEIWASMLFEVYWNMVDKSGFTSNLSDSESKKGNTEFFQLVMNGLATQPCNPTFIQARDSILQADKARNNGANQCEIIKGFAKRGLGVGASDNGKFTDSDKLLPGCN